MRKSRMFGWMLAIGLVAGGTAAEAQVFTPSFTSPRLTNDVGIYLSDYGDIGVEGIWRGGPLGLRLGLLDAGDDLLTIGVEFRNPIAVTTAPVSLAFTAAGQGLFGDGNAFGAGVGLSAGATFMGSGVAFTPYIHPRIGFVDRGGETDMDIELLADIGADVELTNNLIVRFGVNVGEVGADWGLGLAWRR